MAAWHEAADFDCAACAESPEMRGFFGCEAPPKNGEGFWRVGSVEIDRCPVTYLDGADDVWALLRAGSLCNWRLTVSEQQESSPVWVEAWLHAGREFSEAHMARVKRDRDD